MFIRPIEIPLLFVWMVLILALIRKHSFFRVPELGKNFLSIVFLLKVLAGTTLAAVYSFYYTDRSTADIFKYFDDSKVMTDALWSNPGDYFKMLLGFDNDNAYFSEHYYNHMNNWFRKYESNLYNDSHTIIRINAFLRVLSFGSYHVHTLFACFFSLIGLVGIYKAFSFWYRGRERWLALVVFLIPSVTFWGSGVLKEAFLLFGIGIFFYGLFGLLRKGINAGMVLMVIAGIFLLLYLKVYVLMALLPGMVAFLFIERSGYKGMFWKYITVIFVFAVSWVYFEKVFPDYHMLQILVQKQEDFIRLSESMNSGSLIYTVPLEPNLWSFMKAAPVALFNVLFRPFPGESLSPLILMASFEILLLAGACWLIFRRFRRPDREELNLLLFFAVFVGLLFILIGWVTPVMGAIVRYRIPAMPFLGMIFLMLIRTGRKTPLDFLFRSR